TRHLHRWERAGISVAGPATQILLGVLLLVALGVNPFDHEEFAARYSTFAIWWAGPMIGLFNLIPVLPLDGGNIASEFLDFLAPGRGRTLMIRLSIPFTATAFAVMLAIDDLRPLSVFAGVLLVLQFQMYPARRSAPSVSVDNGASTAAMDRARAAENEAWTTGQPGPEVEGYQPSPWWKAFARAAGGDPTAASLVIEDLRDESPRHESWIPPVAAETDHLRLVVELLPRPLPAPTAGTSMLSAMALLEVLRRCGDHEEAIRYGTALYNAQPGLEPAVEVARNLAVTRHPDLAAQWLAMARRAASDRNRFNFLLTHCPEFHSLHHRSDFADLLSDQESPTTTPSDTDRET
ncbi:MAG: hypothetical protein ACO3SP_04255, partial [Ilumatobacteraceae bacterium]